MSGFCINRQSGLIVRRRLSAGQ